MCQTYCFWITWNFPRGYTFPPTITMTRKPPKPICPPVSIPVQCSFRNANLLSVSYLHCESQNESPNKPPTANARKSSFKLFERSGLARGIGYESESIAVIWIRGYAVLILRTYFKKVPCAKKAKQSWRNESACLEVRLRPKPKLSTGL